MSARKLNKDVFADAWLNIISEKIKKEISSITGSGVTLTSNEKEDIIKVIKSLENRGILLKGTTRKITSQEGEFVIFLGPLMTVGLQLIKSVLNALAKSVYQQDCQQQMKLLKRKFMDQELQH